MKKAVWAAIILLAGGAVITATAIDGKKTKEEPVAEKAEKAEPAKTEASSSSAAATVGAPTVEPVAYGNPEAPILIEEFASFTCPHCAHFHKETLPELKKEFLEKGLVRLHFYSYVRNEQDLRATQIIYCVEGNEARQRFTKAVLAAQEQWAFSGDFLNNLRMMAQVGGVSNEQFDKCMADKATEDKILLNRDYASSLGINSTPFFVIGKEEIKGDRGIASFREAIAKAQGEKKAE